MSDVLEWALNEADRMMIEASKMHQMGLVALAKWLRSNANHARRWASSNA